MHVFGPFWVLQGTIHKLRRQKYRFFDGQSVPIAKIVFLIMVYKNYVVFCKTVPPPNFKKAMKTSEFFGFLLSIEKILVLQSVLTSSNGD